MTPVAAITSTLKVFNTYAEVLSVLQAAEDELAPLGLQDGLRGTRRLVLQQMHQAMASMLAIAANSDLYYSGTTR